jgi:hypothetical protein
MANCPVRPASIIAFKAKSILRKPGESFREFQIHHNVMVTVSETSDLACATHDFGDSWIDSARPSDTLLPFSSYGGAKFVFISRNLGVLEATADGVDWEAAAKGSPGSIGAVPLLDAFYVGTKFIVAGASDFYYLNGDLSGGWTLDIINPGSAAYTKGFLVESGLISLVITQNQAAGVSVIRSPEAASGISGITADYGARPHIAPGHILFAGDPKMVRDVCGYRPDANLFSRLGVTATATTVTVEDLSNYPVTETPRPWGRFVEGYGRYRDRVIAGFSQDGTAGVITSDFGAGWKEFAPDEEIQQAYMVNPVSDLAALPQRSYCLKYHKPSGRWFLGTGSAGIFELIPVYAGEE